LLLLRGRLFSLHEVLRVVRGFGRRRRRRRMGRMGGEGEGEEKYIWR
jgi:hypothetical protein